MTKNSFLIVFIFLISISCYSQLSDTALNPLRSTRIQKGNRITLQTDIGKLKDISFKTGEGHYNLKKGVFGGADSIDIEVNKDNLICAVSFLYDTAYEYEKGHYVDWLKTPGKEFQFLAEKIKIRDTRWEDKRTIYELVEIVKDDKTMVYSTVFDKELYTSKRQLPDLRKAKSPFEILKQLGLL